MKNNKGFTLVELITVLAILAILMGIAVPKTYHIRENAALNIDVNNAKLIQSNMNVYYNVYKRWPNSLTDIFGPGKYLPGPPPVQSHKGTILIGEDGIVQVLHGGKVHWCSKGSSEPIENILP